MLQTRLRLPVLLAVAGLLLVSSAAFAQGWDPAKEGGEILVIEERPTQLHHEFSFGASALPLDAFYTGVAGTAAYTYHPSRLFAWEVASGFYSENIDSGLEDELLDEFEAIPTRYEKVQWGLMSSLVFKPLYGKLAWFGGPVLPAETYFVLGGGLAKYSLSYRGAGSLGMGIRLHVGRDLSLRFDLRDLITRKQRGGIDQVLMLGLAVALDYGGDTP